jgi:hypothetical protein
MALSTRKTALFAKLETTAGVDSVPAAINVNLTPVEIESVDLDRVRQYLGSSPQLVVGTTSMLEFDVEIAGAGTSAVTRAKFDELLQACGFASTINASASVDYTPVSDAFKTITLYTFIDGIKHAIRGAVGTVSFDLTAKQVPKMKFKFTGLYTAPIDSPAGAQTVTGWQTPVGVNNTNTSGFALHGFAGAMQSLSIDVNNTVVHRILVGADYCMITDRKPSGSVTIEAPKMSEKDFFTAAINMTLGNLTLTHGTVAFNKFKVDCALVQVLKPAYSDSDGIRMLQLGLGFIPSSAGNDEFKFSTL